MLFRVVISNKSIVGRNTTIDRYYVIADTIPDAIKKAIKKANKEYPEEKPMYAAEASLTSVADPLR